MSKRRKKNYLALQDALDKTERAMDRYGRAVSLVSAVRHSMSHLDDLRDRTAFMEFVNSRLERMLRET